MCLRETFKEQPIFGKQTKVAKQNGQLLNTAVLQAKIAQNVKVSQLTELGGERKRHFHNALLGALGEKI